MTFNVDSFRAKGLIHGGARPSLFVVRMTLPTLAKGGGDEEEKIRFLAQAASLPASTVQQIDVPYFGRMIKYAGDRTFDNFTLNIMNDEDFKLRASFEAWLNGINTHISNRRNTEFARESYKSNATVYQLSKTGSGSNSGSGSGSSDVSTAIRAYTFSGMFPVSIDAIALSFASTNQVESFNVTFAYDFWVPGDSEEGNSNAFNGIDGSAIGWTPKLNPQ